MTLYDYAYIYDQARKHVIKFDLLVKLVVYCWDSLPAHIQVAGSS